MQQPGTVPVKQKGCCEMKKLISIDETCRILGVGKTTTYKLINEGTLLTVHIGRRHLVQVDSIEDLFEKAA